MCIFSCIKGNENLSCSQRSQLPLDEEDVENYPHSFTLSKTNKQNNMLTQTYFIWTAQTVVQCNVHANELTANEVQEMGLFSSLCTDTIHGSHYWLVAQCTGNTNAGHAS